MGIWNRKKYPDWRHDPSFRRSPDRAYDEQYFDAWDATVIEESDNPISQSELQLRVSVIDSAIEAAKKKISYYETHENKEVIPGSGNLTSGRSDDPLSYYKNNFSFLVGRKRMLIEAVTSQSSSYTFTISEAGYDLFISHASDDKSHFVRPLATSLRKLGLNVWYDELSLSVGDSLRRSIDRGLRESRFGVVILSPAFLRKNWPQYELDGLVNKELGGAGRKIILPVWYKVGYADVSGYSFSLADKVALDASQMSIREIALEIELAVRNAG